MPDRRRAMMQTPLSSYVCALVAATLPWLAGYAAADKLTLHDPGAIAKVAHPPGAMRPCSEADTRLTPSRRDRYRGLIRTLLADRAAPNGVRIEQFMRVDGWSLVRAATPFWNPGWFVFEETDGTAKFRDLWNGMGPRGDPQDLVAWATALGAPADFVQCFADTVMR